MKGALFIDSNWHYFVNVLLHNMKHLNNVYKLEKSLRPLFLLFGKTSLHVVVRTHIVSVYRLRI